MEFNGMTRALLASALAVAVAGCGSDSSPTTTLVITPSLGQVKNASVLVRRGASPAAALAATPLVTADTGSTGTVTVRVPGVGPFIVEVQGDADATYIDERTGERPFAAGQVVRALVPAGAGNIGVTPLTDAAYQFLAESGMPLSAANVAAANNAVRQALAPGLADILSVPTPWMAAAPGNDSLTGGQADQYAVLLAALANMTSYASASSPMLALLADLQADIAADGALDGAGGGSAPAYASLTALHGDLAGTLATVGAQYLDNGVEATVLGAFEAADFNYVAPTFSSGSTGGGTGSTVPGTVNAAFVGVHDLIYCGEAGGPYANGQAVQVTVNSNGSLTIPARTLTGPYNRLYGGAPHLPEISWKDSVTRIEYALSDNVAGTFNEINLGDLARMQPAGYPYFLGQLRDAASCDSAGGGDITVTGFSVNTGAPGTQVTISGTGFNTDRFHMSVRFSNNVAAEIVSSTATTLVVIVPAGAVTGPVTVSDTISHATFTTANSFTVTAAPGGGDTWVSRASPSSYLLNGLAYGGGKFVAVGNGKTIMASTDGISWTGGTAPAGDWFGANRVAHDGTRFILVGDTSNTTTPVPMIATSTDGVSWTPRSWTPASTTYNLFAVTAAGGTITVGGSNYALASSTDGGVTWTTENQSFVEQARGLASNGVTRVLVGNGKIVVDTGSGWTLVTGTTGFYPRDVAYTGEQFVAVGSVNSNGDSNPVVMTSQNGTSWTLYALSEEEASTGKPLERVMWNATDSRLYATGYDFSNHQIIISSANGSNWTLEYEATVSGNGALAGIAASPTRIVTVGGVKSVTLP